MTLTPIDGTPPEQRPGASPSPGATDPRGAAPGLWTGLAALYGTALVAWVASGWGVSSELGKGLLNLAFQPLNLAAAAAFWRASTRADRERLRPALRLFAACYLSIFAGNTLWFVQETLLRTDPTYSWPNIPYLLSYAFGIAGLLSLPMARRSRFEWWRFLLDAVLTGLGGGAVIWFVVIRPLSVVELPPLHRAILLAFPFAALVFFVGLLMVLLRRPAEVSPAALRLYVVGEGATLVGDLFYQLVYQHPSYSGIQWTYTVYAASYVVIVWSGEVFARRPSPPREPRPAVPVDIHVWSPLPWIAAGGVYVLLLWNAIQTWNSSLSGLAVVAIALTVLLVAREAATVGQNVRLLQARAERKSEIRFESLVRHSTDPLLILDAQLITRFASPAAGRVAGRPAEGLVGTRLLDLIHPNDAPQAEALLHQLIPGVGLACPVRWRMAHQGGSWRHLEAVVTNLLADPSVHGLVVTAHDVTERDSLEEQLRHAQKMEAIGQLAGGIAHDFNNLLTTILGTAELALERLPPGPLRGEIEEMRTAGRRAAALTGQLLAFSRKQVIEAKVIDVSDVVAGTHRLLQRLIGEHINLAVRIEHDIGCVRGDVAQIEQALVNLIVNARDAITDTGTITLEAAAAEIPAGTSDPELGAVEPGPYVALRVTDTGAGMDPATQARIFEPFFTTKGLGRGTGLGLATVYGTVRRHGGAVTVQSAVGEGSRFTIYLPRVAGPAEVRPRDRALEATDGKETILVVEDEVAVLRTTSRGLRSHGYTVLEAGDGIAAVQVAEAHPGAIDLVVMDVILPGRSGPQVVVDLHRIRPAMRVLYASGYSGRELTPHGLLTADIAFLQKPYSISELSRRIRQVLATGTTSTH
jgi:PAS domain S-box-containing protein